jgi:hypothetical protein
MTMTLTPGLHVHPKRDGAICCDDCGRWADEGDLIRHSKRCDTPDLQVQHVCVEPSGATRPNAATPRKTRRYDECGWSWGHRMDCALAE